MTAATLAPPAAASARAARRRSLRHAAYLTARSTRALCASPRSPSPRWCSRSSGCCCSARCSAGRRPPRLRAAHGTYLEFITPGVVIMTALFSSGWAGTVYIEDMNRGVMDRLLASPVRRGAMMIGTLAYQALTTVVQTLVVFGIAVRRRAPASPAARRASRSRSLAAVLISVIVRVAVRTRSRCCCASRRR